MGYKRKRGAGRRPPINDPSQAGYGDKDADLSLLYPASPEPTPAEDLVPSQSGMLMPPYSNGKRVNARKR